MFYDVRRFSSPHVVIVFAKVYPDDNGLYVTTEGEIQGLIHPEAHWRRYREFVVGFHYDNPAALTARLQGMHESVQQAYLTIDPYRRAAVTCTVYARPYVLPGPLVSRGNDLYAPEPEGTAREIHAAVRTMGPFGFNRILAPSPVPGEIGDAVITYTIDARELYS